MATKRRVRGNASLGGRRFRLDPTSVQWGFATKVADTPTVGGKVVQVYGTQVTDMTVTGTFGSGGWKEQARFLDWMKNLGDRQVEAYGTPRTRKKPFRFLYPDRNWDFMVYLKAFSSPDGSRSIVHDNAIFAPRWTLTLFIVEDNSGLKKVAQNAYISRLAQGIGWKQTKFNGPMGELQLRKALGGQTANEYLNAEFGIGSVPAGNQNAEPTFPPTSGGGTPDQNRALGKQMAAQMGWTGREWEALLELWNRESGWNHTADNPSSSAYGIPQALINLHDMPKGYYDRKTGEGAAGKGFGGDPAVQIRWGLNYIKGRYGSPSKALAYHNANNSY